MLSRDGLALSFGLFPRLALCLPTCFHRHLFPDALAGLDAVTRWSGSVSPLSPHLFPFVSPLVSSRACWAGDGLAWSALCLPTSFLTRLLGWMLSRDGLARSAPVICICFPTCFLTRSLGWILSRDGLALCLPACFLFSPHLSSLACWAGCCHEMVWLGQLFVSPRVSFCLPTCAHSLAGLDAVTRWSGSVSSLSPRWSGLVSPLSPHLFAFVSPFVSSHACWAGCCHKMVWLGQLFVSPLVSFCLPTCFLARLLGWMLSRDDLSSHLSPCLLGWMLSRDGLAGSTFVSPLVCICSCWAGFCHELAWLGQLYWQGAICSCHRSQNHPRFGRRSPGHPWSTKLQLACLPRLLQCSHCRPQCDLLTAA